MKDFYIVFRIEQDRYVDSVMRGNIHFTEASTYKDIEEKFNDHAIGDAEGIHTYRSKDPNGVLTITQNLDDGTNKKYSFICENFEFQIQPKNVYYISSWIKVKSSQLVKVNDQDNIYRLSSEIINNLNRLKAEKEKFVEQESHIKENCSFIVMLGDILEEGATNNKITCKDINYRNKDEPLKYKNDDEMLLFNKDKSYEYQQEIRLVTPKTLSFQEDNNFHIKEYEGNIYGPIKRIENFRLKVENNQ